MLESAIIKATVSAFSDESLTHAYAILEESIKGDRQLLDTYGQELLRRLHARDATEIHAEGVVAKLVHGTPTYDVGILQPLLEALPEEFLKHAYSPEHEETRTVPARWDGRVLNEIERKLGGEVAQTIKAARIPGAESVKVEKVKSETGKEA